MGLFKKVLGATTASKSRPAAKSAKSSQKADEVVNTRVTGVAPPAATGEPFEVDLAPGKQIELSVSVYMADDLPTMKELLGKPQDDDEVSRNVKVWMYRDLTSQYPDAVRVDTKSGRHIGWVVKGQSYFACELINQVAESIYKQRPDLAGRAPKCRVTMHVEGSWDFDDTVYEEGEDPPGWQASIDYPEIRIAAPVNATDPNAGK